LSYSVYIIAIMFSAFLIDLIYRPEIMLSGSRITTSTTTLILYLVFLPLFLSNLIANFYILKLFDSSKMAKYNSRANDL